MLRIVTYILPIPALLLAGAAASCTTASLPQDQQSLFFSKLADSTTHSVASSFDTSDPSRATTVQMPDRSFAGNPGDLLGRGLTYSALDHLVTPTGEPIEHESSRMFSFVPKEAVPSLPGKPSLLASFIADAGTTWSLGFPNGIGGTTHKQDLLEINVTETIFRADQKTLADAKAAWHVAANSPRGLRQYVVARVIERVVTVKTMQRVNAGLSTGPLLYVSGDFYDRRQSAIADVIYFMSLDPL